MVLILGDGIDCGDTVEFTVAYGSGRLGSPAFGPDSALYVCEFHPNEERISILRISR
jgi:hypothetical protein